MRREKLEFIGDCCNHPFRTVECLTEVIDQAHEITQQTFVRNCHPHEAARKDFNKYPHDYRFFKAAWNLYFYEWSAIEHFYGD